MKAISKAGVFCIFTICLFLLLGCQKEALPNLGQSAIILANQERHAVIGATRAATYVVYPDMPDPKIVTEPGFFEAAKAEHLFGTAFGVNADGLVFTAAHVITETNFCNTGDPEKAPKSQAVKKETYCSLITQTYNKAFRAKVLFLDRKNDVGVLRIENPRGKLPFLKLASSKSFGDGAEVLTIGAPLGNANYTTIGYISNLDFKKVDDEDSPQKIQFHATMQPGNSGGPLVDVATGNVVGLVIEIFAISAVTPNGNVAPISTGMSYATPVEVLQEILNKYQ